MNKFLNQRKGIAFALVAAVLFGLSTPLAKVVSPRVEPVLLAGLLYLGSGIGLGAYFLYRSPHHRSAPHLPPAPTRPEPKELRRQAVE